MLKTIKQHNAEVQERARLKIEALYKTGVACPSCSNELKFVNPYKVMMSDPPQKQVKCNKCDFTDTIFVD